MDPFYSNLIKVFPNPAQDIINIELRNLEESMTVELIDVSGNLLFKKVFTNQVQIKISDIPPGVYFTRIIKEGKILHSTKVMKI